MHALPLHRIHKSLSSQSQQCRFVRVLISKTNSLLVRYNNYYNGCLHQLAAGSWDTKSHTDVTYTEPTRTKLNHNLKMSKIKIIPNYYKNIEKAKKLTLPRELIYLRESYISPVEETFLGSYYSLVILIK